MHNIGNLHRSFLATHICASFVPRLANTDDIDRPIYGLSAQMTLFSPCRMTSFLIAPILIFILQIALHLTRPHPEDEGTCNFVCQICHLQFLSKTIFEEHVNFHFNIRPHVCEVRIFSKNPLSYCKQYSQGIVGF